MDFFFYDAILYSFVQILTEIQYVGWSYYWLINTTGHKLSFGASLTVLPI